MKCVVLQQYKLRAGKLVPTKDQPIELDWPEYKKLLAPTNTKNSFLVLRKVKLGSYVGLLRSNAVKTFAQPIPNILPVNFVYTPEGSAGLRPLIAQIYDFENRVMCIYKVMFVDFGTRIKY